MSEIVIKSYEPGVIGEVVRHHAAYYAAHWNFDIRFETLVARGLADFFGEFDALRDGFWWASEAGRFAGAIAVDGSRYGCGHARLRWFIVPEERQGAGIGARLFDTAMLFCRERGFDEVHLWTFAGLDTARRLYERGGFRLAEEMDDDGWGARVTRQKFVLPLTGTP